MNTDELRHLLEMAARACGAQIEPCVCSSQPFRFKSTGGHWSPHVDDGMSARMRTALRMNVIWSDTAVHCLSSLGGAVESFADHNNDRNAALRLCALRVAAAIGGVNEMTEQELRAAVAEYDAELAREMKAFTNCGLIHLLRETFDCTWQITVYKGSDEIIIKRYAGYLRIFSSEYNVVDIAQNMRAIDSAAKAFQEALK